MTADTHCTTDDTRVVCSQVAEKCVRTAADTHCTLDDTHVVCSLVKEVCADGSRHPLHCVSRMTPMYVHRWTRGVYGRQTPTAPWMSPVSCVHRWMGGVYA